METRDIVALVRSKGYQHRDEPFRLASGQMSQDYIDGKLAVAHGNDLRRVAQRMAELAGEQVDAVGGLTMGADPFAHAIAVVTGWSWFSVRKEPKGRGLDRWVEGARLGETARVLLVDDVVTTGGSILTAYERVVDTGATVVGVITFVDRGDVARREFARIGVPYQALVTYSDLGIERVGDRAAEPVG